MLIGSKCVGADPKGVPWNYPKNRFLAVSNFHNHLGWNLIVCAFGIFSIVLDSRSGTAKRPWKGTKTHVWKYFLWTFGINLSESACEKHGYLEKKRSELKQSPNKKIGEIERWKGGAVKNATFLFSCFYIISKISKEWDNAELVTTRVAGSI